MADRKILDNGTLVTLGLVGVVAAAGAVAKRGSAARRTRPRMYAIVNEWVEFRAPSGMKIAPAEEAKHRARHALAGKDKHWWEIMVGDPDLEMHSLSVSATNENTLTFATKKEAEAMADRIERGEVSVAGMETGAPWISGDSAKRGSAARAGGESPVEVQRTLNAAVRDLISVLKRGPGEIRHESDAMVTDETYAFTNINAAAIRAPDGGGWIPATYRSSYDRHTGMEDGDYAEVGAAVPSVEAALLVAIEHELHGEVGQAAMVRGGFNQKGRKGRKGSRSLSPRFAAAVSRGFQRAARMIDHEYEVQFDSVEGWYATNWLGLWATPAPGAIRTSSIAGPKVRDGFTASYDAEGEDHPVGVYPTASGALIGAMISLVMDTVQNTVSEEGYAQSLGY